MVSVVSEAGVGTRFPLRFGVQLQAQRTTWPVFRAGLEAVEDLGLDTVFTFDHMLPVDGRVDEACLETISTLTAMACHTDRIRIGALCNGVMYRDPATFAKAFAMIDQISAGRLECTLGPAWAEREFVTYGLPFPPPAERLRRLDEALTIITSLWTEPFTTFEGTYYHVRDAPCDPKPLQSPHPPIMIGGGRDGTARLAAKHATGWNGIGSASFCAGRIAAIEGFCEQLGRDPAEIEYSVHPELAVAATRERAEDLARAVAAGHGRDFENERGLWVVGTPEEVTAQVRAYIDAGVTHFIFALPHPFDLGPVRLFFDEVVPAVRSVKVVN